MSESVFKAPKAKKSAISLEDEEMSASSSKRPRTAEDFYLFCKLVLDYENYEKQKQDEMRDKASSPIGSTGSVSDSLKSESTASSVPDDRKGSDVDTDEDSYDLITCYCAKPFAGRPMIECSKCLTWVHLSCAKIKKTSIPEVFICVKCKHQKFHRMNSNGSTNSTLRHKKRLSA